MQASDTREVLPAKRTRRRFSARFKTELVALACQPGVSVAQIAMEHQINANQLRRWINQVERERTPQPMVPVAMRPSVSSVAAPSLTTVELVTPHATLRLLGDWDPMRVAALLQALR